MTKYNINPNTYFTQSQQQSECLLAQLTWVGLLLSWTAVVSVKVFVFCEVTSVTANFLAVFSAVPTEHGAALGDTDEAQQQPGAQVCQRKEQLGGAAAAGGKDAAPAPASGGS